MVVAQRKDAFGRGYELVWVETEMKLVKRRLA